METPLPVTLAALGVVDEVVGCSLALLASTLAGGLVGVGFGLGAGLATAVTPAGPAETAALWPAAGAFIATREPATDVRAVLRDVVSWAAWARSRATRALVW